MNKTIITIVIFLTLGMVILPYSLAAGVGRPREIVKIPDGSGPMTLRLYSYTDERYIQTIPNVPGGHEYDFRLPAWDQWYWVGVWRNSDNELLLSLWIGHFRTD